MKYVSMYTDGACKGNPGKGGYGTIIRIYEDSERKTLLKVEEFTAGFTATTNNRMEILAFAIGLENLKEPSEVILTSDSKYLIDSFEKGWLKYWVEHDWKNSSGKDVKNVDLWKRILFTIKPHKVSFIWVKGHAGHTENERCDYLASSSADGKTFTKNKAGLLELN